MTNYDATIIELNNVRSSLQSQLKAIKSAAAISHGSWDSDARKAYDAAISNIERELSSISTDINNLKMYVYKEE